jgi:hypothetical protein
MARHPVGHRLDLLVCAVLASSVSMLAWAEPKAKKDDVDIVSEGGIGARWDAAKDARFLAPGYPEALKDSGASVCVCIGYLLGDSGQPESLTLLKSHADSLDGKALSETETELFIQSAASVMSQWKFVPKANVERVTPTFTSATFTFSAAQGAARAALKAKCAISNLAEYISELGEEKAKIAENIRARAAQQMRDRQTQRRMTTEADRYPAGGGGG